VLAWAEVNGGIAVIDERAGTQAAQARGVAVHGTLWLIAKRLERRRAAPPRGRTTGRPATEYRRATALQRR
jgi:hypothetical protein